MKLRKFDGLHFRRIAITPHSRSSRISQMAEQARNIGYNARVIKSASGTQLYVRPSPYRIRRYNSPVRNPTDSLERGALYATALRVAMGRELTESDSSLLQDTTIRQEVQRQADSIMAKYDRSRIEQLSAQLAIQDESDPIRYMIDSNRALNSQVDAAVASKVISQLGSIAIENYFIQDEEVKEKMREEFDNYSPENFGTWDDILKYSEATKRYVLHNREGQPVGTFSEETVNKAAAEAEAGILGSMRMEISDDIDKIQGEIRERKIENSDAEFERIVAEMEPTQKEEEEVVLRSREGWMETPSTIGPAAPRRELGEWEEEELKPLVREFQIENNRTPRMFDDRPLTHVEVREFLEACGRGDASQFLCGGVASIDYPNWQYSEEQVNRTLIDYNLGPMADELIEAAKGIGIGNNGEIIERRAGKLYINRAELNAAAELISAPTDKEYIPAGLPFGVGDIPEEENLSLPFGIGGREIGGLPPTFEIEGRTVRTSDLLDWYNQEYGSDNPMTRIIDKPVLDPVSYRQDALNQSTLERLAVSANKAGANFRKIDEAWETWMDRGDARELTTGIQAREYDAMIAYAILRLSTLPINHPDRRKIADEIPEAIPVFLNEIEEGIYQSQGLSTAENMLGLPNSVLLSDQEWTDIGLGFWGGAFVRLPVEYPDNPRIRRLANRSARILSEYESGPVSEKQFKEEIAELSRQWTETMELERGMAIDSSGDDYAYLRRLSEVEMREADRRKTWTGPRRGSSKNGQRAKVKAAQFIYDRQNQGMSPPTTGEILEYLNDNTRWGVTSNQLGNYLSKDPRFMKMGSQRIEGLLSGGYLQETWGLVRP